jgi:hypothetical protein
VMRLFTEESLASELVRLQSLSRLELRAEWKKVWGSGAPINVSHNLLILAFAYRLQEQIYGGLKPHIKAKLRQIAAGQTDVRPVPQIKSGTRLLREWRGSTHEVVMLDDGVQYRGNKYRSLSEVAKVITGSKWSGPVFFGLRPRLS